MSLLLCDVWLVPKGGKGAEWLEINFVMVTDSHLRMLIADGEPQLIPEWMSVNKVICVSQAHPGRAYGSMGAPDGFFTVVIQNIRAGWHVVDRFTKDEICRNG